MNNLLNRYIGRLYFALLFSAILVSCEKIAEYKPLIPLVSFEIPQVTVETKSGLYNIKLKLSTPAEKEVVVKVAISGSAIEDEHFTIGSKEIKVSAGLTEAQIPVSILDENIWDENLEIRVLLSPDTDYVVDPKVNPEIKIKLTKQIVYPVLSFDMEGSTLHTNPFNGESLTFKLKLDRELKADSKVNLSFEGDLTIGGDFMINGGNSNTFTIPKGITSHTFEVKINKKDIGGFNKSLKITINPVDSKTFTISSEKSSFTLEVSDPIVDLSPMLKTAALLGGEGHQIYQEIKGVDGAWSGRVALNSSSNPNKKNYLRTHRNLSLISAFGCNANTAGGDVLRLAEILNFANTDTVIADYGAGKTSRYFSPSDSLIRFVADKKNTLKGTVTTINQKFSAKLVLKADWETGANAAKQWHVDSKATSGVIAASSYPTFATIEIELVKLEGTFDFTGTIPEIIFDAWFKSSSPYFMRLYPATLAKVKEGDLHKVSYRFYPR
ncbi:MAG: hypothetical protein A2X17_08975 [Bacteroidetes bacterium GWF2_41_61]|nr:MAG: hypothetical protein A2X20_05240 [Bacteroidetes bacterium GWE2_40_15]OFY27244.1 MAG: hypothetical protein A2X17_08975 [Bacteroidetes bacterium GWF2_41_61]